MSLVVLSVLDSGNGQINGYTNNRILRTELTFSVTIFHLLAALYDRFCGLVVRVLGYRSGGPGSIPGTTSLVSTTEELLDRKVAAPL
jgi:hypothetical protein